MAGSTLIRVAAVCLCLTPLLTLGACVSHEQHLDKDAASCRSMGHPPKSAEFWSCLRQLNERRCEQLGSRNPMCAGG